MLRPGHVLHDRLNKLVLRDAAASRWLTFERPAAVFVAYSAAEVRDAIAELERRVNAEGLHAAGYLAYEAAPAFDPALTARHGNRLPLACFGLFDAPAVSGALPGPAAMDMRAPEWRLMTTSDAYRQNVQAIREQIALGNTYQVNYTIRQQSDATVDPWQLFLRVAADAPYAAYLDFTDFVIVSASPELFFLLDGNELCARPMKGTARRGTTTSNDNAVAMALYQSAKDRAENVMITDMIRNDIGRIADPGSVTVESLYDVEKYATVWQMTSTVRASTTGSLSDILQALFPCASVTGAPKVASMQIIASLEDSPREVYTGAIGYLAPERKAQFSVAIRTAWIDRSTACYGIGGGIIWDSSPDAEFEECLDKARILSRFSDDRNFDLLETMLWTSRDGYFLIDEHLERLRDSAEYFDFAFDRAHILGELSRLVDDMQPLRHRVRLLLGRDGQVRLEHSPLPDIENASAKLVRLAAEPIDRDNPFLYHKTTNRGVYKNALAAVEDCDDVLLWNADGCITETTVANVVVRFGEVLFTPAVSAGLLPGTYRNHLLRHGEISARDIHIDELDRADEIMLINSVRGVCSCELVRTRRRDHRPGAGYSCP